MSGGRVTLTLNEAGAVVAEGVRPDGRTAGVAVHRPGTRDLHRALDDLVRACLTEPGDGPPARGAKVLQYGVRRADTGGVFDLPPGRGLDHARMYMQSTSFVIGPVAGRRLVVREVAETPDWEAACDRCGRPPEGRTMVALEGGRSMHRNPCWVTALDEAVVEDA